jgi:hypothetical protein
MISEYDYMAKKLPKKVSEKRFRELIDELVDENCCCDYCFLKQFVASLHPEPFVLVQLKCIEMFKWEESSKVGEDIGWNEAGMRWANEGYALSFRAVFDADLPIKDIYKKTLENNKKI